MNNHHLHYRGSSFTTVNWNDHKIIIIIAATSKTKKVF